MMCRRLRPSSTVRKGCPLGDCVLFNQRMGPGVRGGGAGQDKDKGDRQRELL